MNAAHRRLRAVLFDLDGTLADTAPDLASALNVLRAEHGLEPLPVERVRPCVSEGTPGLLDLGFDWQGRRPQTFEALRARYLAIYRDHLARETRLFPGVEAVLQQIEVWGYPWGIVTNKMAFLTEPLVAALGLQHRAACVVSGDSVAQRKPHPEPLLLAARQLHCAPAECLFIGDSQVDIAAGRAAGMITLIALFGYLAGAAEPRSWGADGSIAQPSGLLPWIDPA